VRLMMGTAAFVVVVAGIRAAESLLVPFLLSVFIAVVCAPPLFWLRKKRVPTILALLVVVGVFVVFSIGLGAIIGSSVDEFSRNLPVYQERIRAMTGGLIDWFATRGIVLDHRLVTDNFDPGSAMRLASRLLSGLGGVLTNGFLILLTVVFILLEAADLPAKLRFALPDPDRSLAHLADVANNINRYMAIKTLTSAMTGIAIGIWLTVLGVDHAVLWGILAFLLNYVPNIGSVIAALPAVLLALVQTGPGTAALSALGYVVVNVIVGNVVEPRLMGRGLGLSTLVVFLSLVFWGWVLGPVGMLLSVPLTMTVKIALSGSEETRWIAVLLGPEREAERIDTDGTEKKT